MTDIIKTINTTADIISLDDFEWIVPKLLDHYQSKIDSLSRKIYVSTISKDGLGAKVSRESFKQQAKDEMFKALDTFLFKTELWKNNRDINTYLLTCLNRLGARVGSDINADKFVKSLICPACKLNNKKEYLFTDGNSFKCNECTRKSLEDPNRLSLVFSNHSKKGYRCPDCKRFIPASCNTTNGILCPYSDCCFSGEINQLERMEHPFTMVRKVFLRLNHSIADGNKQTFEDRLEDISTANADTILEVNQSFKSEKDLLKSVISEQLGQIIKSDNKNNFLQKTLMYEAYLNMLELYTEDMIGYLIYNKIRTDFPLQARIFQKYVELMKDSLPHTINNKLITSLLDPELKLFNGISKYSAKVRTDHTIGNFTKERYISNKSNKDYGPCYIGSIIDIVDKNSGESIKDYIDSYGFVEIKMKNNILDRTPVEVTHYRILSHYEVGSLVYLQKIRKKIGDRIYIKLNGRKK